MESAAFLSSAIDEFSLVIEAIPEHLREFIRYIVVVDPTDHKEFTVSVKELRYSEGAVDAFLTIGRNAQRRHKRHVHTWLCQSVVQGEPCLLGEQCPNIHLTPEGYLRRRPWVRQAAGQRSRNASATLAVRTPSELSGSHSSFALSDASESTQFDDSIEVYDAIGTEDLHADGAKEMGPWTCPPYARPPAPRAGDDQLCDAAEVSAKVQSETSAPAKLGQPSLRSGIAHARDARFVHNPYDGAGFYFKIAGLRA